MLAKPAVLALMMTVQLSCAARVQPAAQPPPPARVPAVVKPAVPMGRIVFDCEPADAQVFVDDNPQGIACATARQDGLALPRGYHRVVVKSASYQPFRFELILKEQVERISVHLKPAARP